MTFSYTIILIIITCIISFITFNNEEIKSNLLFSPYQYVNYKKWWILISHGFIHADFLHLFFNMYVLYIFGPTLEFYFINSSELGGFYYIGFYLLGIIFSTLPSILKHKNNPSYNSLGASGAVSSVVFAYIIIYPLRELGLILIPGLFLPGFIFGIFYLLAEHYLSKKQYSNIAHDAHISGSLFGVFFIVIYDFNNLLIFFQKTLFYFQTFR
ncbi:MAG: rhomboid family intramembrane serine protease [Crocinitomicaceae bacterium]|nr:rhomboid family intramembrane serine protease [Crocinitomicaceae bacterium]|tara:strand:- start:477 stop:1112 length:636 start_codon:yes stop_codon:yes gene_type:complete